MGTKDIELTDKTRGRIVHDNLQGIYNLAPIPQESPYFSKLPCDGCLTTLAGDRYNAMGTDGKKHNTDRIDLAFCTDCYGWLFT